MKFTAAIVALVALPMSVLADGASVKQAINNVDAAAIKYNGTITAYTNSAGAQATVQQLQTLLKSIDAQQTTVQASDNLSGGDSLNLIGPVNTLVNDVQTTLNNIVSKKGLYAKDRLTTTVRNNILAVQNAADDFSDAVIAKVPQGLQNYARSLISKLDPAFDNAVAQYS